MSEPLRCTECGVPESCSCHKPTGRMTALHAAELAIKKYRGLSDPAIAGKIKVSDTTVFRARASLELLQNEEVERRVGLDGKSRPARRRQKFSPEVEDNAAEAWLDQRLTHAEACAKFGISDTVLRKAIARVEGRREQEAKQAQPESAPAAAPPPPPPPPPKQSRSDAAAVKAYQRELDAKFEMHVQAEIKRRVEQMVMPALREREQHAERVAAARKGIFKLAEYNLIQKCLHPDLQPTVEMKTEAFRLLHENRLVLMSEKEDPQPTTPGLPTVEEFMRGYPWKGKA